MNRISGAISALFVVLCAAAFTPSPASAQTPPPGTIGGRVIYRFGQQLPSSSLNQQQKNLDLAVGAWRSHAIPSMAAFYANLCVTPVPSSLTVQVGPCSANSIGAVYQKNAIDPSPYGGPGSTALPADTTQVPLQGMMNSLSAPIGGMTANATYTIEAQVQVTDTNAQPINYVGQNGVVTTGGTALRDRVNESVFQSKTGSTADAGWLALATIVIPNGVTAITQGMIAPVTANGFNGFVMVGSSPTFPTVTSTTDNSTTMNTANANVSAQTTTATLRVTALASAGTQCASLSSTGVVGGTGSPCGTSTSVTQVTGSGNVTCTAGQSPNCTTIPSPSFTSLFATSWQALSGANLFMSANAAAGGTVYANYNAPNQTGGFRVYDGGTTSYAQIVGSGTSTFPGPVRASSSFDLTGSAGGYVFATDGVNVGIRNYSTSGSTIMASVANVPNFTIPDAGGATVNRGNFNVPAGSGAFSLGVTAQSFTGLHNGSGAGLTPNTVPNNALVTTPIDVSATAQTKAGNFTAAQHFSTNTTLLAYTGAAAGTGYYQDATNMALRISGSLYFQGPNGTGTVPGIAQVGDVHSTGTVYATAGFNGPGAGLTGIGTGNLNFTPTQCVTAGSMLTGGGCAGTVALALNPNLNVTSVTSNTHNVGAASMNADGSGGIFWSIPSASPPYGYRWFQNGTGTLSMQLNNSNLSLAGNMSAAYYSGNAGGLSNIGTGNLNFTPTQCVNPGSNMTGGGCGSTLSLAVAGAPIFPGIVSTNVNGPTQPCGGCAALGWNFTSGGGDAAIATGYNGPYTASFFHWNGSAMANSSTIASDGTYAQANGSTYGANASAPGTMTAAGFYQSSRREWKYNVTPVAPKHLLDVVTSPAMRIFAWCYNGKGGTRRETCAKGITKHLGPMANDAWRVLLSADGKHLDLNGLTALSLGAVQALAKENVELRKRLELLEAALLHRKVGTR